MIHNLKGQQKGLSFSKKTWSFVKEMTSIGLKKRENWHFRRSIIKMYMKLNFVRSSMGRYDTT